jgi:dihydrofolate synthase/folylpolyglutamate synthase
MEKVEVVLLEVGLGGRLDATNVISPPKLAVITSISMDHMEYLGNTIQDITREKCGIIKSGTDSVIVSLQEFCQVYEIISKKTLLAECNLLRVDLDSCRFKDETLVIDYFSDHDQISVPLKLKGHHQVNNACTALLTLSRLEKIDLNFRFTPQNIKTGMENVVWPGRLESLFYKKHDVLIDGAHNVAGAKCLKKFVKDFKCITWVLGFSQNKDVPGILDVLLEENDSVIALGFESPVNMPWVKCLDPLMISSMCTLHTKNVTIANDFDDALKKINHDSTIIVCGSLYLCAKVSRKITRAKRELV